MQAGASQWCGAQSVVEACEQPFLQLEGPSAWVSQPSTRGVGTAWHRGLQLATALRYWLHPTHFLPRRVCPLFKPLTPAGAPYLKKLLSSSE